MKNFGVFCGGFSSEYEISIKSADTIIKNFPKEFRIFKIIITRKGWEAEIDDSFVFFDLNDASFICNGARVIIDCGIVYIHGNPGENGKIQAYLDMKNIPYLNSGVLASSLSFDKWYCNQFLKSFEIPVAKSIFLRSEFEITSDQIKEELGLPVFVKPSDSGSSYGISKVKTQSEIEPALKKSFAEGGTTIVESFLDGVEVTCGVYRNIDGIQALPLTEIVSENEFFDFDAKYNGKSNEITPARVSEEVKFKVQERAKYIYSLLQLRSIARIDFMIVNDEPFVIEVNTTPGFSSASIVPQMLACHGTSITDFWRQIINAELGI
ncbi:MAG: D-alanine--D-alanine ligase [Bacteroidetes bacterium]|nr:D-alanine--D-alanine ligase [Bacteroidota bacterium]